MSQDAARHERPALDPYRTPALRIEDAGAYLGVGRSGSYDLVRRGELPTIKLNGRSVVRTVDLMRLLGLPVPMSSTAPEVMATVQMSAVPEVISRPDAP